MAIDKSKKNQVLMSFIGITPIKAKMDYQIIELKANAKYLIQFNDKAQIFIVVSDNQVKPFANNPYWGVLVIYSSPCGTDIVHHVYIRGQIAVITNVLGDYCINQCGALSDLFFFSDLHREDTLRRHFQRVYYDLWLDNTESWESSYKDIRKRLLDFDYVDGKLIMT